MSRKLLTNFERNSRKIFFSEGLYKNEHTRSKHHSLKPFNSIPGPKKWPLIGNLHLFSRFGPFSLDKLYDAYFELHQKYGPIIKLHLGISYVALFRAEDVQKLLHLQQRYPRRPLFEALRHYRLKNKHLFGSAGLVAENGPPWWKLRKPVNFMMKPQFAAQYFPAQQKIAEDFVARIRFKRDANFEIPNFLTEIYRYTEETIGTVCFGTRLGLMEATDSQGDSISSKLTKAADDTLEAMADTLLGFPWWKIIATETYRKLVTSQEFFRKFALDCVDNAMTKAGCDEHKHDPTLQFLLKLTESEELNKNDVSLLITEIFSTGIDATGNSIGFLLYNLTQNPEVQEKLYNEISNRLPSNEPIEIGALQTLDYLRACIKESYRMSPTAGGIARILDNETEFCGYHVPANVLCVGINPVISRLDRYFRDPHVFRPERWLNTSSTEKIHPYCVLPFSHGVRRCVGQRFAEMEILLCLIHMVKNFRLEYDGPKIGSKMRLMLTPDKPLNFRFIDR